MYSAVFILEHFLTKLLIQEAQRGTCGVGSGYSGP